MVIHKVFVFRIPSELDHQIIEPLTATFPQWEFQRTDQLSDILGSSSHFAVVTYHPAISAEEQTLLEHDRSRVITIDRTSKQHSYAAVTLAESELTLKVMKAVLQMLNNGCGTPLPSRLSLLQQLVLHIPGAAFICRADDRWTMLYLSPKIYELTGYPVEDFLHNKVSFADLYHPEDRSIIYDDDPAETSYVIEYRIQHRDGYWKWIREYGSFLDSPQSGLLLGVLLDITQEKETIQQHQRVTWQVQTQQEAITRLLQSTDIFYEDLNRALRDITEVAAEALDIRYVSIWLFDEDFSKLQALDFYDRESATHTAGTTLSVEQYPKYFAALREAFTINAPDARTHEIAAELTQSYFIPYGIISLLDAPIRTEGKLRGVICFEDSKYHPWSPEEQFFAFAIAEIFALVLESHEKRQLYQQIQFSQQRTQAILRSIGDALIATDSQGKITLMNPVAEQLTGWHQEEALGKPIEEVFRIVREDTLEPITDFIPRILREGQIVGLANHTVLRTKDGAHIPIDDSGAPIIGADGSVQGAVIVFHDITKRRRWEQLLEYSSNRYQALLNALPDVIAVINRTTGTLQEIFASDIAHPLVTSLQHHKNNLYEILPELICAAVQTRTAQTVEFSLDSSTSIWYEIRTAPIDAETSILIFRDISSYKAITHALQQHQRNLKTLLDTLPIGCVVTTADRILYANAAFATILGYPNATELMDRSPLEWIPPENKERIAKAIQSLIDSQVTQQTFSQHTLHTRSGKPLPVLVHSTVIQWDEQPAMLAVVLNFSELRAEQETLQHTLDIATALNQLSTLAFEAPDLDTFWYTACERAARFLNADITYIAMHDADQTRILYQYPAEDPSVTSLHNQVFIEPSGTMYFTQIRSPELPYQEFLSLRIPFSQESYYTFNAAFTTPLSTHRKQVLLKQAMHIATHFALLIRHLQQQQALAMQMQQLQDILDTSPSGIAVIENNALRIANAAFYELLDIPPDQEDSSSQALHLVQHLLQASSGSAAVMPHFSSSGKLRFLQILTRQTPDNATVLVLRDVTDDVRYQRYLELQVKYLELLTTDSTLDDAFQHLANALETLFPLSVQIHSIIHNQSKFFTSPNFPSDLQTSDLQAGLHPLKTQLIQNNSHNALAAPYSCYWRHRFSFSDDMEVVFTILSSSCSFLNSEIPTLQVMVGNLINLALRKRHLELQFNEALQTTLQSILSSLNMYIFTVRKTSKNEYYYSLALGRVPHRFLQRPTREIVGQKLKDILPPEEFQRFSHYLDRAFAGEQIAFEEQWANKYFLSRYTPVRAPSGEILEILAASVDITEHKLQAERVELSERRLKLLLEHLPVGIIMIETSPDRSEIQDIFLNSLAQALLGKYPKSPLHFWYMIRKRVAPQMWNQIEDTIRRWRTSSTAEPPKFITEYHHPQGRTLYIQVYLFRLPSLIAPGNQTEVAVISDVTDFKRVEDQLKSALIHEQQLREFRTMLMRTVSHELRTPLTAIQLAVDILKQYWDKLSSEQRFHELNNIRHHVQDILHFMEDLLNRTKVADYRELFSPSRINLPTLLHNLIQALQPQIQQKQHTVKLEAADHLPSIIGDQLFLSVAFRNLLNNAIKYSPDRSTITIRLFVQENYVAVQFHDQGIGISPEELPYIFESFYRASNVGEFTGSGIGLAIVKEFIEFHNGKILVESELGKGTIFTILLPITASEDLLNGPTTTDQRSE